MILFRAARCGFWLLAFPTRSRAVHNVAHIIQSAPYEPLPSHLRLRNVVVVHRHGDRSQITREIGPLYPEDAQIESIWNDLMPSKETVIGMVAAAALPEEIMLSGSKDPKDVIYTGWDKDKIPYGMLTDVGAKQLRNIGTELRRRYVGTLLPANVEDASSWLYCRSTNFCRTMQSLRSLLSGLLDIESTTSVTTTAMGETAIMSNKRLPIIVSRPKHKETMFPSADGPCLKMNERRGEIFPPDLYHTSLPFFENLESRMKVRLFKYIMTHDITIMQSVVPNSMLYIARALL